MYITHLSLTDFRNFSRLDADVPRGALMLVGNNAQGKTSLLEAVYFLATFTSFQAGSDRQLINFIAAREPLSVGRITADFKRGEKTHRLEVRIIQEVNGSNGFRRVRKEVLLDGVKRKINELFGQFNAVLFLPQMLSVIDGSPEERRRYLNLALAQTIPDYAANLSVYNRSINQRNALLKQINERNGDPEQLTYWDEQITSTGAMLIHARIQAVREIEKLAAVVHHDLTRGDEVLRLDYRPAYDPIPETPGQFTLPLDTPADRSGFSKDEIVQGFSEALVKLRGEEIARGQTTIGPHRDEVRFLANSIDLGTYGSRGQIRTTMLALKMAEVTWMKNKTGQWPVLLLDEVLAELDPRRREDLLARLSQSEQALLTTTDLDLFSEDFIAETTCWNIQEGKITNVES
jgi:DNA replication and repair protein RecF